MLHPVDWAVLLLYVVFVLWVGVAFASRAGASLEEYFLSGRRLPWWIAGTSMVATSFAADTPLLISGWVREGGIARNWVWWCYAVGGSLQIWFFARWWRRGGVMTKAELAELRYGGTEAQVLRGLLGVMHAWVMNTMTIAWVLLAAQKIAGVLFGLENELVGLALACLVALSYSLLAGFWGVVVTDLVQFVMAMTGATVLAILAWNGAGGSAAILHGAHTLDPDNLRFLPAWGEGSFFSGSFWTAGFTAVVISLCVQWWAVESVDGTGTTVQRVAASRDEHQGMLAVLWFNVTHYAMRPWCWIAVGLASLVVLPQLSVTSPVAGRVVAVAEDGRSLDIATDAGVEQVSLAAEGEDELWRAYTEVEEGSDVAVGEVLAASDPELAYLVMMRRFLPVGLLGLVAASLMAAFMSTIDTHVNLAASFFVNDVYRRFLNPHATTDHYVGVARITCVLVLAIGALIAANASSVRRLFEFFLAFGGGVGLVYVLRWFWWRIRAATEIAGMLASAVTTTLCTHVFDDGWAVTALTPDGVLSGGARLLIVVVVSLSIALVTTLLLPAPDPASLVPFYRRVRPPGAWGPVRALVPDAGPGMRIGTPLVGSLASMALVFGAMVGIGFLLLERQSDALLALGAAAVGGVVVFACIRRLDDEARAPASEEAP